MLITSAPIVIPVNTANVPTESVAAEAAQRPKIPQPPSASEGSRSKNSTEFNEQPKSTLPLDNSSDQNQTVEDKNGSQQQNSQSSNQQQSEQQLEAEELAQVQKLRNRDREVKAHEQAHASVGGTLAGAPNLNYTTGPDGKRYAVSGDVSIDISKVPNDPEATIRKLEQVQRAALAPANPSAQDAKVAAVAAAAINQARAELNVERLEQAEQEKQARSEALEETQNFSEPNEINSQLLASDVERSSAIDDVTSNNQSQAVLNSNAQAADLLGLNPVQARRQAAQLNQRIAGSGALDVNENPSRSFRV